MTAELYRRMLLSRLIEERLTELASGLLKGLPLHLNLGQEATPMAVGAQRADPDVMVSTHRGLGHCLGWGADPATLLAETVGRRGGYARGLAGHMHVVDPGTGILGTNGIVGGGLPIAVGAAVAMQRQGLDGIAVAFTGDGAANTGAAHEALNMAAAWKAPVLFVCENNGLAEMTYSGPQTGGNLPERAAAYGLRVAAVDGADVEAVYDAAGELLAAVRGGEGPAYLHAETFRASGHFAGDLQHYRDIDDAEQAQSHDPIERLVASGSLGEYAVSIRADVQQQVDALFEEVFAMDEPTAADLMELGRLI